MALRFCIFIIIFNYSLNISAQLIYPAAQKTNHADTYFNRKIQDPYQWLEYDTLEQTKKWITEEKLCTKKYLSNIPFREKIFKEIKRIYDYKSYYDAFGINNTIFFTSTNGLKNQPIYYRQTSLKTEPKVFLDPNLFSVGGTTSAVIDGPSKNKRYISYHINKEGSDWRIIKFIDVVTLKELSDSIKWVKFGELAWTDDGYFYAGLEQPEKSKEYTALTNNCKIYFHKIGTNQSSDKLIYEDSSKQNLVIYPTITRDGKYLFIHKEIRYGAEELLFKDVLMNTYIKTLFEGYKYLYEIIGNYDNQLFIYTNDNASNYKIIKVDINQPERKFWKNIIPEKKEKLELACIIGNQIITSYLKNASSRMLVYKKDGAKIKEIKLPELCTISNFKPNSQHKLVYFNYSSFSQPSSIWQYDLLSGKVQILKNATSSLNSKIITTERFCKSKDGTIIHLFLVHKQNLSTKIPHPTILYGYGGFNTSLTPSFLAYRLMLLKNNGIFVIANIRGGGEYGENWHLGGLLDKRQNSFDDFIAAADYLVSEKITTRDNLTILGKSNGGILVTTVINQRPDLCKVAIPLVPVTDMLRYQKFTLGRLWATELGSSDSESQFNYLIKYSPLHNINKLNYPATFVQTADHDDRVVPLHSYKYTATLQQMQQGKNPILIEILSNQGHGSSGSALDKTIENWTNIYSFIYYNINLNPFKL